MPLSNVTKEIRLAVRKAGYTVLTLALTQLVRNGNYNLAAAIIVALCLSPRKSVTENNGVLCVLRNIPLYREAQRNEMICALRDNMFENRHCDQIMATLVAAGWWESYYAFFRHTDPMLSTDDGMLFYNAPGQPGCVIPEQVTLCDLAGCQHEHYFQHTRLIRTDDYYVRVIGKQMDRWNKTKRSFTALPNGYFECLIPAETVVHRMRDELCGRTLSDIMEPNVWYNVYFEPDTPLDLVNHEAEKQLAAARQDIANLAVQFGQLNG
jgi:hypothetical protein